MCQQSSPSDPFLSIVTPHSNSLQFLSWFLVIFLRVLKQTKDKLSHFRVSFASKDEEAFCILRWRQFYFVCLHTMESVPTVNSIGRGLANGSYKRVIVLAGAGISVPSGIPDFRSKDGLYATLEGKFDLPQPESIFDIEFFQKDPRPFYSLAAKLYPGTHLPSLSHHFVRLLHERGLLLRMYTQNIDTLERIAGIPSSKLVEAHGSFATAHCAKCGAKHSPDVVKSAVGLDKRLCKAEEKAASASAGAASDPSKDLDAVCVPSCSAAGCDGKVKPGITFFGEMLSSGFGSMIGDDCKQADLLLVLGTSLRVYPVADVPLMVSTDIPRLLINRDLVYRQKHTVTELRALDSVSLMKELERQREIDPDSDSDSDEDQAESSAADPAAPTNETGGSTAGIMSRAIGVAKADGSAIAHSDSNDGTPAYDLLNMRDKLQLIGHEGGFLVGHPDNTRDAWYEGDCDDGVAALCGAAGWMADLEATVETWNNQQRSNGSVMAARGVATAGRGIHSPQACIVKFGV